MTDGDLLLLNNNTLSDLTVCKQMTNRKLNYLYPREVPEII